MGSFLHLLPIVGATVSIFSLALLVPLAFSIATMDGARDAFVLALVLSTTVGAACWFGGRRFRREMQPRDGFLLVALVWTVLPAFAMLPLLLSMPDLSVTDAYFEAMSGLTATGATALVGLDELPTSINVWRCFMQWIGGMGIVVLAVALLSSLGIGGYVLMEQEAAGPTHEKLVARTASTAKSLWGAYAALTAVNLLLLWGGGFTFFESTCHAFTTMSSGGFSTFDSSMQQTGRVTGFIQWVTIVFMVLAGMNFSLHYSAFRWRWGYWARNSEMKVYLLIQFIAIVLVTVALMWSGTPEAQKYPDRYDGLEDNVRQAAFNVVSVCTTTGFASANYDEWPAFTWLILFVLRLFGGSAGSTAGGLKTIRVMVLMRYAWRELARVIHPNKVITIKVDGKPVDREVMSGILAFLTLYLLTYAVGVLLLAGLGESPSVAVSGSMACISSIGPGLMDVGPTSNFAHLGDASKWVCAALMLLGRLEILSVLVLVLPRTWKR
jgi:trk system potassium uptake protein TrkH